MARAHRIGQTRAVKVYRLLTAKTYEMHMFHSASMKLGLDRAVLAHQRQHDGETSKRKKTSLEKESHAKEIDQLLKKGAYDIFCDDDGEEAKQFMETDIDQLLERNSRTVTYGKTETPMSKGLGSFSKASFVSSAADGKDIDLDDPDFWSKAIGLEKPEDGLDENLLLLGEKRNRKQVQVYDPYAFFEEDEEKEKKRKAQKIQDEKSEKKRQKEEKKNKKGEDREQKKKNDTKTSKDKQASSLNPKSKEIEAERWAARDKKFKNDLMIKKQRRDEQKKILHAIAKDDPLVDRMKQAWEPHHRDGVIDSVLRFGFGRFCKVRHEASLTRIPIQDIEVFVRSCKFIKNIL
jgi:chromodomain-helicase-DNA-binding protein 7